MKSEIVINKEKNLKIIREENNLIYYKDTEIVLKSTKDNFLEFMDSFIEETENDEDLRDIIILYFQVHQNIKFKDKFVYLDGDIEEFEIDFLNKKAKSFFEIFTFDYFFKYIKYLTDEIVYESAISSGNKIESTIVDIEFNQFGVTTRLYLFQQLSILFNEERYESVYENVEYREVDEYNPVGYYYNKFTGKRID